MLVDLFDYYQTMRKNGIIFSFSGPTSQSVVEGIGEALRHKMELDDTAMSVSQKVFSIFVEQMQNVVNYSAEKVQGAAEEVGDLRYGALVVGKSDSGFYILSGNYISKSDTARLTGMLESLSRMNKDELKVYYREQRRKEKHEQSKGAGLGLIEAARKASRPLKYSLVEVDPEYDYLSVCAVI